MTKSTSLKYEKSVLKEIIKGFYFVENNFGMAEIPITYFMRFTDIPSSKIYDIFNVLILDKKIKKIYYSECPYCSHQNRLSVSNEQVKCSRCNQKYLVERVIEKFKYVKAKG